jgi:hypothetical protein
MSNILTKDELSELVNHSVVKANQEKLSNTNNVSFSIPLSEPIKVKLETHFGIDLTQSTIPMRWVKGDTAPHKDRGEKSFEKTCLVYLTDSVGEFVVDGQSYPIQAGDAHTFHEGTEHYTIHTEGERLLMGPMSETGNRVGAVGFTVYFFTNDDFQSSGLNPSGFGYIAPIGMGGYSYITLFDIPPPTPISTSSYYIDTSFEPADWTPPPGKTFGGWKYWSGVDFQQSPTAPLDNNPSKIYMPGETYTYSATSVLIPNWIDAHPVSMVLNPMRQFIPMHFSNNATVYYKSHSLSVGGGGSGVRNARHKKRKT